MHPHQAFQSVQDDGERQKRRKAHHSVSYKKLEGNSNTYPPEWDTCKKASLALAFLIGGLLRQTYQPVSRSEGSNPNRGERQEERL